MLHQDGSSPLPRGFNVREREREREKEMTRERSWEREILPYLSFIPHKGVNIVQRGGRYTRVQAPLAIHTKHSLTPLLICPHAHMRACVTYTSTHTHNYTCAHLHIYTSTLYSFALTHHTLTNLRTSCTITFWTKRVWFGLKWNTWFQFVECYRTWNVAIMV